MTKVDLNRVATFVRVVETGSFTAAATALGLPTSSVSRSVATLEDALGVRLLHRTTRKLALTPAGQRYFDRMEKVMAEATAATQAVAGLEDVPRGTVRITAPVDLGVQELPRILAALAQRYPEIVIDLLLTSRQLDLVEGGIDLAIRGGRLDDSTLMMRRIAETELGLFAAPTYFKQRPKPRVLADLARHACVLYRAAGGHTTWRLTGPNGAETVAVAGRLVTDDMMFVHQAVLIGMGIGLLPVGATVRRQATSGALIRVLPRHAIHGGGLFLVWPSRRLVPARVALVRDFLADELAKII